MNFLLNQFVGKFNHYVNQNLAFVFVIDYEMKNFHICPLQQTNNHNILFNIKGKTNDIENIVSIPKSIIDFEKTPIEYSIYKKSFDIVYNNLKEGNSYLTNLTFASEIKTNLSLNQIFRQSNAPYKLYFKNRFVVFSPETFIKIQNNTIYSFPMKGTIDASLPNAEKVLLSDRKEQAEHNTIVDLIRNDLSMVAEKVKVDKFRYIETIKTNQKDLLQVSSKISGEIKHIFSNNWGELIINLLPAGSISGAPKRKTVEIISQAEKDSRGYYTGIFGLYENNCLDTAVMIRFIEKKGNKTFFRSGGGITINSDCKKEYNELIQKIYVPIV